MLHPGLGGQPPMLLQAAVVHQAAASAFRHPLYATNNAGPLRPTALMQLQPPHPFALPTFPPPHHTHAFAEPHRAYLSTTPTFHQASPPPPPSTQPAPPPSKQAVYLGTPSTPSGTSPRSLQRLARKAELARQSRKRKKGVVEQMEGQIRLLRAEVERLRERLGEAKTVHVKAEEEGRESEDSEEDGEAGGDAASATSTGSVEVSPSSSSSSLSSSVLLARSTGSMAPLEVLCQQVT